MMRRIAFAVVLAIALGSASLAQVVLPWPGPGSAVHGVTLTPTAIASDTANSTTYTFTSQNFGTAAADRYIIVVFGSGRGSTGIAVSSATIGGVAASLDVQLSANVSGSSAVSAIMSAPVPTGTSGTVAVTLSGAAGQNAAISVYSLTGSLTGTPSFTNSNGTGADPSTTLNCPAGGAGVGGSTYRNSGGTTTWSGLTETPGADFSLENLTIVSMANSSFSTTQTGLSVGATHSAGAGGVITVACYN